MMTVFNKMLRTRIKPFLGRWGASCTTDKNIISSLANMDHCGEYTCKNPKEYKKMIDTIIHEEQSNKNDLKR